MYIEVLESEEGATFPSDKHILGDGGCRRARALQQRSPSTQCEQVTSSTHPGISP